MKKILLLITVHSCLLAFSFAQQYAPTPGNKIAYEMNQYLLKAKKQKTAAWICLGGGLVLASTGVVIGAANMASDVIVSFATLEETQSDYTGEGVLMLLGCAGIVTSIPLFIASGKNRQKARLLFSNQKTFGLHHGISKKIPGLTVSISL